MPVVDAVAVVEPVGEAPVGEEGSAVALRAADFLEAGEQAAHDRVVAVESAVAADLAVYLASVASAALGGPEVLAVAQDSMVESAAEPASTEASAAERDSTGASVAEPDLKAASAVGPDWAVESVAGLDLKAASAAGLVSAGE
ncbi:MAG TPA: hypothetical protein VHC22_32855 [Pirellulales bacterium]|nr:hypothetical protein [Pirellulales bacterium]